MQLPFPRVWNRSAVLSYLVIRTHEPPIAPGVSMVFGAQNAKRLQCDLRRQMTIDSE